MNYPHSYSAKRAIRFKWTVAGEAPIELLGSFTEERWEQFRKQPHPVRRDVTVEEIIREVMK